jgi:hypothetical protein
MGNRTGVKPRVPDVTNTDEGDALIAQAFRRVAIGGEGCVQPEDAKSLEQFQDAFAAADEWESNGLIEIVETQEGPTGPFGIHGIRFRRLK